MWYYIKDNQQQGPIQGQVLQEMISSGLLTPETLVWSKLLDNWKPAKDVPSQQFLTPVDITSAKDEINPSRPAPITFGAIVSWLVAGGIISFGVAFISGVGSLLVQSSPNIFLVLYFFVPISCSLIGLLFLVWGLVKRRKPKLLAFGLGLLLVSFIPISTRTFGLINPVDLNEVYRYSGVCSIKGTVKEVFTNQKEGFAIIELQETSLVTIQTSHLDSLPRPSQKIWCYGEVFRHRMGTGVMEYFSWVD